MTDDTTRDVRPATEESASEDVGADATCVFDSDGVIVDSSAAFSALLGVAQPTEVTGESLFDFIHERDRSAAERRLRQVMANEAASVHVRLRIVRADAEIRIAHLTCEHDTYQGTAVGRVSVSGLATHQPAARDVGPPRHRGDDARDRGAAVVVAMNRDGKITGWNERALEITGYGAGELASRFGDRLFVDAARSRIRAAFRAALEDGRASVTARFDPRAGEKRLFEFRIERLEDATGTVVGAAGIGHDVARHWRPEAAFEALQHAARTLIDGTAPNELASEAVRIARTEFAIHSTAMYVFDETATELRRAAVRSDSSDHPYQPVARDGDPVWTAFAENHSIRTTVEPTDGDPLAEHLLPIGDHGVCCFTFQTSHPLQWRHKDLEAYAAIVEAALDRTTHERTTHELEQRIADQHEQLAHLRHLNTVLRDTVGALTSTVNDEDVEEAVCRELADQEPYEFAWLAHYDPVEESLTPAVWSGVNATYIDHLKDTVFETAESPVRAAVETNRVAVIQRAMDAEGWPGIRQEALTYHYQSLAIVPVTRGEQTLGVLGIHAAAPDAFGADERATLEQLGKAIATTILSVEQKRDVLSDDGTRLEFVIEDSDYLYSRLTDAECCRCEHEGLMMQTPTAPLHFISVQELSPSAVQDLAERYTAIQSLTVLADRDHEVLCELELAETPLLDTLVNYGASLVTLEAEAGRSRLVVDLPHSTRVRTFMTALESRYPTIEFLARRPTDRTVTSSAGLLATASAELTDRQFEVLQAAFHSGFFHSPRETTGADIADALDIASPTFHHHLRKAQRRIFGKLLGAPATDPSSD